MMKWLLASGTLRSVLSFLLICYLSISLGAQTYRISFALDMRQQEAAEKVGVRGNIPPLSWKKTFYLVDKDEDGIYEGEITVESAASDLQYKFVKNDDEYELSGEGNRRLQLNQEKRSVVEAYNVLKALSAEEVNKIRFEAAAIEEDVALLKKALRTIHPNLYRYLDSVQMEREYKWLEQQLKRENNLPAAYKYLSQFIAKMKCSHTHTNPWNQQVMIKQALFYQKSLLPFSFHLINQRMLIERNASEKPQLEPGLEILSINGLPVDQILQRLLPYISADGSNDAKRYNSLQVGGKERFEIFDIVYPLEFGNFEEFQLRVKDHRSGKTVETKVAALTKFERKNILQERYDDFAGSIDEQWHFEILNGDFAYLQLGTFSVWNMEMNWKKFLADAFRQINQKNIPHLIIDNRGNSGGLDEVYQFILQRLVQEPISIERTSSKVAYKSIPEELRAHIRTWDDSAFDFGEQVQRQPDGYYLQTLKNPKPLQYKPRKDGFRGKTFLITDASNSSATHYMANYIKKYKLGTLVGQATGGNQRGINGGMIFFTTLPNTGIEVDIPIFGSYSPIGAPDAGIEPDLPVKRSVEDFIKGVDTEMEAIFDYVAEERE